MTESSPLAQTSSHGRVPKWVYAACGVILVIMFIVSLKITFKPQAQAEDFGAYYRAAQAVSNGETIYKVDPEYSVTGVYVYAPAFAYTVLRPLTLLPYLWAVRVFLVLNWIVAALLVRLCVKLVVDRDPELQSKSFWITLVTIGSAGMYLWYNLHSGQVGAILSLCCVGWLYLQRKGWPFVGGLLLSIAIGLKIYPALLVPFVLLQPGAIRSFAGVMVGLAILFIAPIYAVGASGLLPLHLDWLRFCVKTQEPFQTFRTGNQSLLGMLSRLPWISNGFQLYSSTNLDRLNHAYPIIVLALTGVLYSYIWIDQRRRGVSRTLAHFSLLLLLVTFASPRAWKVNFAAEILPAALLAAVALGRRPGGEWAAAAMVSLVIAVALPTDSKPVEHWSFVRFILTGKHFFAAIVVAIAVCRQRLKSTR